MPKWISFMEPENIRVSRDQVGIRPHQFLLLNREHFRYLADLEDRTKSPNHSFLNAGTYGPGFNLNFPVSKISSSKYSRYHHLKMVIPFNGLSLFHRRQSLKYRKYNIGYVCLKRNGKVRIPGAICAISWNVSEI